MLQKEEEDCMYLCYVQSIYVVTDVYIYVFQFLPCSEPKRPKKFGGMEMHDVHMHTFPFSSFYFASPGHRGGIAAVLRNFDGATTLVRKGKESTFLSNEFHNTFFPFTEKMGRKSHPFLLFSIS
jgi:hypothetical protein